MPAAFQWKLFLRHRDWPTATNLQRPIHSNRPAVTNWQSDQPTTPNTTQPTDPQRSTHSNRHKATNSPWLIYSDRHIATGPKRLPCSRQPTQRPTHNAWHKATNPQRLTTRDRHHGEQSTMTNSKRPIYSNSPTEIDPQQLTHRGQRTMINPQRPNV